MSRISPCRPGLRDPQTCAPESSQESSTSTDTPPELQRRLSSPTGFSIGDLARRSRLSKQTLSKLEMGNGNPIVDTLAAVGAALDVSLRRLVTEWGTPVFVHRADDAEWMELPGRQELALDEIYGSG